jgi:hypothetical protein
MKKVNIRQAFTDAVDQTDPGLIRFEAQMFKWAKYIEKEIGSINGYPRAGKLYTVTGSTIVLPDNCLQVLRVVPGDYEDDINVYYRDINDVLIQTTEQTDYLDEVDIDYVWKPLDGQYISELFWEQIGNELNLVSTFTDQEITVIYNHLEKNDQGYYIVNDSHIDAITKYIVYMFGKKNLWNNFKSAKMIRTGAIEFVRELKRDYNIAIRNSRAEDGAETPFETEQY